MKADDSPNSLSCFWQSELLERAAVELAAGGVDRVAFLVAEADRKAVVLEDAAAGLLASELSRNFADWLDRRLLLVCQARNDGWHAFAAQWRRHDFALGKDTARKQIS